jgi:hypothetical protein
MYKDILERGPAFYEGGAGGECDFGKISAPVACWMGELDCVLDVERSVALLRDTCGGEVVRMEVLEGYGHCDMWYSKASKREVTGDILKVIEERGGSAVRPRLRMSPDKGKAGGAGGGRSRSRSRSRSKTRERSS